MSFGIPNSFLVCKMQNDDLINLSKQKENPPASRELKKSLLKFFVGVLAVGIFACLRVL